MNKTLLFVIIIMFGMSGCANLPRLYSPGVNYGWAIDSETLKPIKNVIVLEAWELEGGQGFLSETDFTGVLLLRESVTDEKGYYHFDSTGPIFTANGRLSLFEPRIVFYKKGYEYKSIGNDSWKRGRDNKDSQWKGEKIKLGKFIGNDKEYKRNLKAYSRFLYWGYYNRVNLNCMWTKIPRFTAALLKERPKETTRRKEHYIPPNHVLVSEECSDIEIILEKYKNTPAKK